MKTCSLTSFCRITSTHLRQRIFCATTLFIAGLTMAASALPNADPRALWPQYGFDARHTVFNPSDPTLSRSGGAGFSREWKLRGGNGAGVAPLGGPALFDGVLYVPAYAQTMFIALDAETGATRWIYAGLSTFSDPAIWNGHVYTASLDGNLY